MPSRAFTVCAVLALILMGCGRGAVSEDVTEDPGLDTGDEEVVFTENFVPKIMYKVT